VNGRHSGCGPRGKQAPAEPAAPGPPPLDLVRRLACLAQVPLALNNARKTTGGRSISGRKSACWFTKLPVILITGQ
jgi:hypothetical protein